MQSPAQLPLCWGWFCLAPLWLVSDEKHDLGAEN